MTVVAVLADPPRAGHALPDLPETSPLSPAEAADLAGAMLRDTFLAVERSGGDLLVNYPAGDDGAGDADGGDAEAELRSVAADALEDTEDARFEVQVGSTFAARAGNAVTHLLGTEDVASAAVVRGDAPLVGRTVVDNAAMKLRRSGVVLGPASRGRTYYAGFAEPVDFEGAFAPPELETLTRRGVDAGLDVDFLPHSPVVETGEDLLTLVTAIRARRAAGRIVPPHTAAVVSDLGLAVREADEGLALVRE